MKKRIGLIFMIIILLFSFSVVKGTAETIEVNFIVPESVEVGNKTIQTEIAIGNILGLNEEQKEVEISGNFIFNESLVEKIIIEPLNGWNINYANGDLVGNIDYIKPNKTIAKITFNLKEQIKENDIFEIKLNNFLITNYDNIEQTYNFAKQINAKSLENDNINKEDVNNESIDINKNENIGNENIDNENIGSENIDNENIGSENIGNENNGSENNVNDLELNKKEEVKSKITKLPNAGSQNIKSICILLLILGIIIVKFK